MGERRKEVVYDVCFALSLLDYEWCLASLPHAYNTCTLIILRLRW